MPKASGVFAGLLILAIGAGGAALWWASQRPLTAPPLALPEPTRYDPEVVASARKSYTAAESNPSSAGARGHHAMVLHANGALRAADAEYSQAIELDSDEARWWFYRGRVRARIGQVDDAIDDFGAAIERDPGHPSTYWNRGFLSLDLGDVDAAERDFRAALQRDPMNGAATTGMARVMIERGRSTEAIELISSVMNERQLTSTLPYLHGLLATAHRQLGNNTLAVAHLARAEGMFPSWPDPWTDKLFALQVSFGHRLDQATTLLGEGRADEALRVLDTMATERADDLSVLIAQASAHSALGNTQRAVEYLERVLVIDPHHTAANVNLSMIHQQHADFASARRCVEIALANDATSGPAHERLAQLQLIEGRSDLAVQSLERALEYGFDTLETRVQAGRIYNSLGQGADARRVLEAALDRHSNNPSLWVALAWTWTTLGNSERAQASIERARSLNPTDPFDMTILEQLTRGRNR